MVARLTDRRDRARFDRRRPRALLAAGTGFCAGCELYKLTARLRGISPRHHGYLDPAGLAGLDGQPRTFVEFTHPLCAECREWEARLSRRAEPLVKAGCTRAPGSGPKYGIAVVPTVVAVAADGTVLERLAP